MGENIIGSPFGQKKGKIVTPGEAAGQQMDIEQIINLMMNRLNQLAAAYKQYEMLTMMNRNLLLGMIDVLEKKNILTKDEIQNHINEELKKLEEVEQKKSEQKPEQK